MLGVTSGVTAEATHTHKPVYIALKPSNTKVLYDTLQDISDPLSNNYGKWLDKGEVDDLVDSMVDKEGNRRVMEWLNSENIDNIRNYGDAIKFSDDHDTIIELFNVVEDSYDIPSELQQYVEFVEMSIKPIERISKINMESKHWAVDDRYFGRESMMHLYNLPNKSVGKAVSGCLVEYQDNAGFTNEDLNMQQGAK